MRSALTPAPVPSSGSAIPDLLPSRLTGGGVGVACDAPPPPPPLSFGNGGVLRDRDPEESEKSMKYTNVLANAVILHNVYDMTAVLRDLIAEGFEVRPQDIATLSPYLTNHIKRFGEYTLSEQVPPDFTHVAGWELPAAASPGVEEAE